MTFSRHNRYNGAFKKQPLQRVRLMRLPSGCLIGGIAKRKDAETPRRKEGEKKKRERKSACAAGGRVPRQATVPTGTSRCGAAAICKT
jgi:hypothetical protein